MGMENKLLSDRLDQVSVFEGMTLEQKDPAMGGAEERAF